MLVCRPGHLGPDPLEDPGFVSDESHGSPMTAAQKAEQTAAACEAPGEEKLVGVHSAGVGAQLGLWHRGSFHEAPARPSGQLLDKLEPDPGAKDPLPSSTQLTWPVISGTPTIPVCRSPVPRLRPAALAITGPWVWVCLGV